MVEQVDLVVVEGDHDLELRVVVELADADVLPVGPVTVVALAVEVLVVAGAGELVVPRPGRAVAARRLVELPVRSEHEYLCPRWGGVRRCRDHLDGAVAVEVGRGEAAHLGLLATAGHRRGPARLGDELAVPPLVRAHRAAAADHDLGDPVAVEIGDDGRGIDPPGRRRAGSQLRAGR